MALFDFDLDAVEDIRPWGPDETPSLSWYALSDGRFRVHVGDQTLFRYTDALGGTDAHYMVAGFARDVLGSVMPGVARLPPTFEAFASNWDSLWALQKQTATADEEDHYTAWRWIGARSPWISYLVAGPQFQFVRIGDEVRIHWDNRDGLIEGKPAWTAQHGMYALPVAAFIDEARDFATRLLDAMHARIDAIEAGTMRPQMPVDVRFLREQHETWRTEFASYFNEREPDMPWDETEAALRGLAAKYGVTL